MLGIFREALQGTKQKKGNGFCISTVSWVPCTPWVLHGGSSSQGPRRPGSTFLGALMARSMREGPPGFWRISSCKFASCASLWKSRGNVALTWTWRRSLKLCEGLGSHWVCWAPLSASRQGRLARSRSCCICSNRPKYRLATLVFGSVPALPWLPMPRRH